MGIAHLAGEVREPLLLGVVVVLWGIVVAGQATKVAVVVKEMKSVRLQLAVTIPLILMIIVAMVVRSPIPLWLRLILLLVAISVGVSIALKSVQRQKGMSF